MKSLTFLILFASLPLFASDWKGITTWYQVTGTSDNKSNHKIKVEQGKEAKKMKVHGDCQIYLFFCGFQERFQEIDKVCKAAWKKHIPVEDVDFTGFTLPHDTEHYEDGKSISQLIFLQPLEYGSMKSFKIQLAFNKDGNLNTSRSRLHFRELKSSSLVEDDSKYKSVEFGDNAVYFELGAKCPVEKPADKKKK